jgi:S-adenosylmethionine:tRNA ribosyltransferase-isomerase
MCQPDWLLDSYDFDLPEDLIAQHPPQRRDASRMLLLDRASGQLHHHAFSDLLTLLPEDCTLVFNNTRVIPARLLGKRRSGARLEALLLEEQAPNLWSVLVRKAGRIKQGEKLEFGEGRLLAVARERRDDGTWLLQFETKEPLTEVLEDVGLPPLPPYIKRREVSSAEAQHDRERYQTCYAKESGAVAAPTAGLHFTPEILTALDQRGIERLEVTLHVGRGTFAPVQVEDVRKHSMHFEAFSVNPETLERLKELSRSRNRLIAIGTTSVRVLETLAQQGFRECSGWTNLFLYPPYRFQMVDGLLTNFHLPKSTLLLLVSALCGRAPLLNAYAEAIRERYRFFSYGDCMLLL